MPGPVVAVHPGGARRWNRRWPLARYGELCQALARSRRVSLVLVGSAEERPELCALRDGVTAAVPAAAVTVSAGESLNRLARLLDQADVLVGNDSAPAHIAAALGTPTVVLYGPTGTEFLWRRVYLRHHGVNHHYLCQPYKEPPHAMDTMPCRFSCPFMYAAPDGPYPRCMTDINEDEVHSAVLRQLGDVPS
jgi:heptosyltransferase-2/glycosyl transferase protein BlmE